MKRTATLCSNYDLAEAADRVGRGVSSKPQLWGADALAAAGYDVRYAGFSSGRAWRLLRGRRVAIGDWLGQWRLLWRTYRSDVLVVAEQSSAALPCWLRARGLLRVPVVVVVHPELPRHSSRDMQRLLDADFRVCLSTLLADGLVEHGADRATTVVGIWGAEAPNPVPPSGAGHVVATGKTLRDYTTLAAAARASGVPVKVLVPDAKQVEVPGDNLFTVVETNDYPLIAEAIREAAAVVIPLQRTEGTYGLTELGVALALGRPVIMTANPYVDIDPEALGFGYTVGVGDAAGLAAALSAVVRDQHQLAETAARQATDVWTYDHYCSRLLEAVDAVVKPC